MSQDAQEVVAPTPVPAGFERRLEMKKSEWIAFQKEHGREWCDAHPDLCPIMIIDDIFPITMGDFFGPAGIDPACIIHSPTDRQRDPKK